MARAEEATEVDKILKTSWTPPGERQRWYHKLHSADEVTDILNKLTNAGFDMDDPELVDTTDSSIPGNEPQFLLSGVRAECACPNCSTTPIAKPSRRKRGDKD